MKSRAESVSRQPRAWADSLQNSKITGQRYLNGKVLRAGKLRQEREEFMQKLDQIRRGNLKAED